MIVVSMFDKVANSFQAITVEVNGDVAKRNFSYAVNNSPELLFKAKDLELYKIGEFDIHSGVITPLVPHDFICRGDELING